MSEPVRPWVDLLVLAVDRISTTVEGMHGAIARPWFRLAGPADRSLRGLHTQAIAGVYRSVRSVARTAGRVSDLVQPASTPVRDARSDAVRAFTNAVWGDDLMRRRSPMATAMSIRSRHGVAIPLDRASVAESFPAPSDRIVVLLHGLGQTERCFAGSDTSPGLAAAIEASPSTPVLVRYNSGRPVASNGEELADQLGELVEHWPVPVTEISLVGYSMGGLVARAAIHSGRAGGERWSEVVRHLVTIAAPHAGSPIEKAVELASRSLMVAPQTRPLAGFLQSRSAGIRDLRSGVDLPSAFDGVEHHAVAAVVTSDPGSNVGSVFGDLVVRPSSAVGRVSVDSEAVIGGRRHFDILDDPMMIDRVLRWIDSARAGHGQSAVQPPDPLAVGLSSTVTASPSVSDSASRTDRLTGST